MDDVLTLSGKSVLHIYVDLKGCMQALFQEWAVRYIIDSSRGSQFVDTTVFASFLEFIAFHKTYAKKRNIKLKMHFFLESGKSSYHLDVHKLYKADRGTSDFFGLDDETRALFFNILDKNYNVIDKVGNKIPDVTVHRLMYLEADFVPWYLMNNVMTDDQFNESAHLIYSADKDLVQCLHSDNIFQYCKHYKCSKILSQKDILEHVFKTPMEAEKPAEWFCMALAICGDIADGFAGIKGIGGKTCAKIISQIMTIAGGSMDKVYQNIHDGKPVFDRSYEPNNKAIKKVLDQEDIIVRNLKLLSFQLLSDAVDGGYPDYMIDRKNQMMTNLNNTNKAPNASVLYNALNSSGLTNILTEQTIVDLF
jgi:hypothetical protein